MRTGKPRPGAGHYRRWRGADAITYANAHSGSIIAFNIAGGGNYCPGSNNTRGQMAVFITKTFHLQ